MAESQSDKAYALLKGRIIDNILRPGSPVVESDIASELNMSRTPIRDAIRRLDSDGLLEIVPRKGTYIRLFTITDLVKLYEVAEGLEGMVAFLVAERAGKQKIDLDDFHFLEKKLDEMNTLNEKPRRWSEADALFHAKLYTLSGNEFIQETLTRIRTQLNITLLSVIPTFVNTHTSNEEHKALFNAIKDGKPALAKTISQSQHSRIRKTLLMHCGIE